MAFEKITLDVNANGEMQTFHSKQYDVGRPIIIDLVAGEDAYTPAAGITFELHCRKVDFNLVVLTDYEIDENEITFATTEQLTACVGDNLATLKLFKDELEIATMNFILNVAIDPDAQGITSESEINNLTTQIEEIVEEVMGDDYYDKSEVDALLDDKADVADVYTKTETDTLLSAKANTTDLATVATTGSYDDLTNKPTIPAAQIQSDWDQSDNTKVDYIKNKPVIPAAQVQSDYAQSDNTQVDYIKNKPDIAGMINQAIYNILPASTATGNPCTFDSPVSGPLVSCKSTLVASGGNGSPSSPIPFVGYSEVNINANGITHTISLGDTYYNGVLDVTNGKFNDTTFIKENFIYGETALLAINQYGIANFGVVVSTPFVFSEGAIANCLQRQYTSGAETQTEGFFINAYNELYVRLDRNRADNISDFVTWANANLKVLFTKQTGAEIDVTPEQISAVVGNNSISSDAIGDVEVEYKDTIQHYLDTRS